MNFRVDISTDASEVASASLSQRFAAREKRVLLYLLSLILDCAALVAGYQVALLFREQAWLDAGGQPLIALALPVFLMFEVAREVQCVETLESRSLATQRALGALLGTALVVLALSFLFKANDVSRLGFVTTFGFAAIGVAAGKLVIDIVFVRWMRGDATATVVLLDGLPAGDGTSGDLVDVQARGLWPDLNQPSMIDALSRIIAPYDRVVVSCNYERREAWATFLKSQDVGGEILLDRDLLHGAVAIGQYGKSDTLVLSRGPLSLPNRIQKRLFDILTAAFALVFFAPLMLVVAVWIKLETPGPVLFRQVRVGQGNRQFRIMKFRSMRVEDSDDEGAVSTQRNDARVTKIGQFIRRTSIDELPQLFNVLAGDMSMVGPRPHALGSVAGDCLFWEISHAYWIRHALKPGITGLAQIRGFRGATQTEEDLKRRVRADLEYVSNWSLGLDMLILMRTLRVVVHKNAY